MDVYSYLVGVAVLGGIGYQFSRAKVRDRLYRGRRPFLNIGVHAGRNLTARGQRFQRDGQPIVQRRRVNAAGNIPQVSEGVDRVALGGVEQLTGGVRGGGQLL